MTIFCAVFVHHAQGLMRIEWTASYLGRSTASLAGFNRLLFVAQQFVVIMWILAVVLLGMGGLIREKAAGISPFTLSLPVSRTYLLGARIGLGLLQATALAVVPWAAIFLVSSVAKVPILISQVGFYVALLVGGGSAYFAMAILVSCLVEGEYTGPAVAFGIVLLTAIVFDSWLRPFSLWRFVTGDLHIDRHTYLLSGHFPWLGMLASLFAAALMLLGALKVVQRQEF
jgi:ABC-2 type transport system permease protein